MFFHRSPNSSSLDRAVTNGHIISLHVGRSDDAKNIVRNHGHFQNQCIRIKLAAGQAFDAHVGLDLTVILLADSVIMVQGDHFLVGNIERCSVHINFRFWKKHLLTISGCRPFCDLVDHSDGEFSVLFRFKIPPCTADIDSFSVSGIDETSYRKGHKYITVVVNHANNSVVWVSDGFGKEVLREFFEKMTTEQRSSIEIITANGDRWISDLVEEYLPNATMCVDSFHVVQWINDALDELRIEAWREALGEVASLSKGRKPRRGRPAKDDAVAAQIAEARKNASDIKGSLYALGKNPEHLTERQKTRLEWLVQNN